MNKRYWTLFVCLSVLIAAHAQQQITNFHAQAGEQGSSPGNFTELNGKLLFRAFSENYGNELWIKDTPQSTARLLADISVGPEGSAANWDWKGGAVMDGYLYFAANDGKTGDQIWRTDGVSHTEQVTDVLNGYISELTAVGHTLFFATKSGQTETLKLWKTDGSKAGTVTIKNITVNIPSNFILFATACNNLYFFAIYDDPTSTGYRVWRSDGTVEGTYATTDQIFQIRGSDVIHFAALDNAVYIVGTGDTFGQPQYGLLKITGDPDQTEVVKIMGSMVQTNFQFGASKVFQGEAYFLLYEPNQRRQIIWKTDGTTNGTVNLYDDVAAHYYTASGFFEYDDALFFTTANANNGTSLARISGGSATVTPVVEISQNEWSASFFIPGLQDGHITKSGNNYIVQLTNESYATVAYTTDLTAANTKRAPDLDGIREMFPHQDQVYPTQGPAWQLSVVNESATGSTVLQNLATFIRGMDNTRIEVIQDNVFFDGDDGTGKKLWMYHDDASPIVTLDKNPQGLTLIDDQLYYAADGNGTASELRRTSGSTSTLITPQDADQAATAFDHFAKFNNAIYFTALSKKANSLFLGKIEGNTYTLVANLEGGSFYYYPNNLARLHVAGNKMFAVTNYYNEAIWITDGTSQGTTKVKAFGYDFAGESEVANNLLFYIAPNTRNSTDELWISDGTIANTKLIGEFASTTQSEHHYITALGHKVIFVANTRENGFEIWQSDGTAAGTVLVKDIWPGPASGAASTMLTRFGNKLYFAAISGIDNGVYQSGLWATDGTTAGTTLIKDDHTNTAGFFPKYLAVAGDTLYFQASDTEHGTELWKTDGTTTHTTLDANIGAGAAHSSPKNFRRRGTDLVFAANVSGEGEQLWKMNVVPPTPPVTATENPLSSYLAIYPNPTDGVIRFQTNNITGLRAITLIDLQGRTVARPSLQDGNTIQTGPLPAGIYILTAETAQGQFRTRVVKK